MSTPSQTVDAETIEQKYAFSICAAHTLRQWLDVFLRPDAEYDEGLVTSIYYDSPTLELYGEKRNSDYRKTKVRLRWYGDLGGYSPTEGVPCFIEVKRKVGAVRDKQRVPIRVPLEALQHDPFYNPTIARLPDLVAQHWAAAAGALVPLLTIQYRRRRYVDPETGARVAFDTDISCPHARALPGTNLPVRLPVGVLEVKSRARHLPRIFSAVASDLRKEAFSKYALCYEALTQPRGRNI